MFTEAVLQEWVAWIIKGYAFNRNKRRDRPEGRSFFLKANGREWRNANERE